MAYIHFKPKPGRFGIEVVTVSSEKIGALTSAGTDTFRIPTPYRKAYLLSASVQTQVVPVVTTGTATATIKKFIANGGGNVTLSSGLDLETLVANKSKPFVIPATVLDTSRVIRQDATNGGDTLYIESVNGTTIATPPTAMFFVLELALLE